MPHPSIPGGLTLARGDDGRLNETLESMAQTLASLQRRLDESDARAQRAEAAAAAAAATRAAADDSGARSHVTLPLPGALPLSSLTSAGLGAVFGSASIPHGDGNDRRPDDSVSIAESDATTIALPELKAAWFSTTESSTSVPASV